MYVKHLSGDYISVYFRMGIISYWNVRTCNTFRQGSLSRSVLAHNLNTQFFILPSFTRSSELTWIEDVLEDKSIDAVYVVLCCTGCQRG